MSRYDRRGRPLGAFELDQSGYSTMADLLRGLGRPGSKKNNICQADVIAAKKAGMSVPEIARRLGVGERDVKRVLMNA